MSEEKKKEYELIANVTQLFMTLGIKSLTMNDIASKLGVSKKTLYKYVSDKKELVTKSMQCIIDEEECMLSDLNSNDGNSIDRIFALNRQVSEKLQGVQPAIIFDLQKYYPEAWSIMEEHKSIFIYNQVRENLEEGVKEGLYRDNLNPEIVARIYVTLVDSIFESKLFGKEPQSFVELHTEVARYHIRGIASEQGIKYIQTLFQNKPDQI